MEARGEGFCACEVTIDDEQIGTGAGEGFGGGFGHFSGANEGNEPSIEVTEDLGSQLDSDAGDGHRTGTNEGFRANTFGGMKRAFNCATKESADGAQGASAFEGVFDLTEDLGFADNERIERGCDAKEVTDSRIAGELEEMTSDEGTIGSGDCLQKAILQEMKDFGAVAIGI